MAKAIQDERMKTEGITFSKLGPAGDKREYIDFLMEAYKDQFNNYKFKDKETVTKNWMWQYVDNPAITEGKPLVWIARMGGKIAGQLCLMPAQIKIGDKIYKGGWTQDFIILPECRNMGIGRALVGHVLKESAKYIDIVLAAGTNEGSYSIFKGTGFIDAGSIGRNIKVINHRNISAKLTDSGIMQAFLGAGIRLLMPAHRRNSINAAKVEIAAAKSFDEEFDSLWSAVAKTVPNIVKRDKLWLKWRFTDQPYLRYNVLTARVSDSLKGYCVIREGRLMTGRFNGSNIGIVSDILFSPDDSYIGISLLDAVIGYFGDKVDMIRCDILDYGVFMALKSSGFINIRSNNKFLVHPLLPMNTSGPWHVSYGDSDLDLI